jgi:hypothetical protein
VSKNSGDYHDDKETMKWKLNLPKPEDKNKNESLIQEKSMSVHRSLIVRRGINPGALDNNIAASEKRDFTRYPQTIKASNFLKEMLPANKLVERDLRR